MPSHKPVFDMQVVGCKVNQVEANMLAGLLEADGWQRNTNGGQPDLVLVHTCTVTQRADRDSLRFIRQIHQTHPKTKIAVSGCLAELEEEKISRLPGVAAVINQHSRSQAAAILRKKILASPEIDKSEDVPVWGQSGFFAVGPNPVQLPRSRAFIKIEDGCDGLCAYCRVRLARGKPVSRSPQDIVSEITSLIQNGYQEIVLTGVNLGCWQPGLAALIPEITRLPGDFRIRLSSLEPQHLNDELIQALAQAGDKLCAHLHLPLQSGDDEILSAMRRTYDTAMFRDRVNRLKALRPEMVFTGDVIVGFPGETRTAFENTCQMVRETGFARLHVFPFSARPGTEAADFPGQLASREITDRARELRALSGELYQVHLRSRIGKPVMVLLEEELNPGEWAGTTEAHDRAIIKTIGQAGKLARGTVLDLDNERLVVGEESA